MQKVNKLAVTTRWGFSQKIEQVKGKDNMIDTVKVVVKESAKEKGKRKCVMQKSNMKGTSKGMKMGKEKIQTTNIKTKLSN